MKIGFRTPSIKRSISARTTGRVKRAAKSAVNPLYGKKGMGYINNTKKAIYNKVYNKTTVGISDVMSSGLSGNKTAFEANTSLLRIQQLQESVDIINQTTNAQVFFSRFDFALGICDELKDYEYTGVIKNATPAEQKQLLLEQFPPTINSFIVRAHDKAVDKAQELKTEKGKHNRIVRFYNDLIRELNQYGAQYITQTNIDTIKELAEKDNITDEIEVNLTPVNIDVPSAPIAPPPVSSPQQTGKKLMCYNCKEYYVSKSYCPACNTKLIEPSEYVPAKNKKSSMFYLFAVMSIIFFCFDIFFLLLTQSLNGFITIAFIACVIMAFIISRMEL